MIRRLKLSHPIVGISEAMSHPPIESTITFFYTHDLDTSARFYEDVLGLELWLAQEVVGFIGLVVMGTWAYAKLAGQKLHSPTSNRM
jgi:hypothetical protein